MSHSEVLRTGLYAHRSAKTRFRTSVGETKNLDYEVVEVQNEPEGFDESEADAVPIDFVQEREDIDKMKAYTEFFEYCRERLISLGAKTIGDLPAEEQKIIAEKAVGPGREIRRNKIRPVLRAMKRRVMD